MKGERDKEVRGDTIAIKATIDGMQWVECELMDVRK